MRIFLPCSVFERFLAISEPVTIMRFHLCGGLDAPDWILANIVTLTTIPSARVKVLVEYIIQRIAEGNFDYENALKITTDASLEQGSQMQRRALQPFISWSQMLPNLM